MFTFTGITIMQFNISNIGPPSFMKALDQIIVLTPDI